MKINMIFLDYFFQYIYQIQIFENNNTNIFVNVYGLENEKQNNIGKNTLHPLKVVDEVKSNHFDLLLINDNEKFHYSYISNFSRLVVKRKPIMIKFISVKDVLLHLTIEQKIN